MLIRLFPSNRYKSLVGLSLARPEAGIFIEIKLWLLAECSKKEISNSGKLIRKIIKPLNVHSKKIPDWLRGTIVLRDDGICQKCGKIRLHQKDCILVYESKYGVNGHLLQQVRFEIDHIIPVASGGLTKESNLQLLCRKCNRSKGHTNGTGPNAQKKN